MALGIPTAAVALLEEDPELGAGIPAEDIADARRLLTVPALTLAAGPWDISGLQIEPTLGLLVLDGLITVNIVLGDRAASQLAGPGDILQSAAPPEALLPASVEHFVSERARLAVLDRRFIAGVRRWPALLLSLHERLRVQEHRLAVHSAVGRLRRVDHRIVALMWHLAERWGRIGVDGVVVPLSLTHETIGRLVGAERPTVTLALGELARSGDLVRRDDGSFLLSEESKEHLRPARTGAPQLRPVLVAAVSPEEEVAPQTSLRDARTYLIDLEALRKRIAALGEELPEQTRSVDDLLDTARRTALRSAEVRARVAAKRAGRGPG